MFDTICHEHLEYYSVTVINNLLKKVGLRIFDHNYNDTNGGSSSYYICHHNAKFKISKKITMILKEEKRIKIHSAETYKKFKHKIDKIKVNLRNLLTRLKLQKKIINGFGG